MKQIYFDSVQQFNDYYGFETLHPLVSVVRYDKQYKVEECISHYGLYAIFLKENKGCQISYGRTKYDFDEMTVTTFSPGQAIRVEPVPGVEYQSGLPLSSIPTFLPAPLWARIFHAMSSSHIRAMRPFISRLAR